ncbi:MAG: DUF4189 domain-containing protein [Candidatus Competibacteraceae bacterium]|nr:MAG: DUF4189 domain-containing protein [Candidatus Competibacteraceae bacterium]
MKGLLGLLVLIPTVAMSCGCATMKSPAADTEVNRYGVAVYAPSTRDWRLRWQAATLQQAQQRALQECAVADCQVVLEFGPGQCGTLALGRGGIGVGQGDTPAVAEAAALNDCQRSGPGCRVAPAECNR